MQGGVMENIDKSIFNYLFNNAPSAAAKVLGGETYPDIVGLVEFYPFSSGVLVVANVDELPKTENNIFAFHIHEGNSCENNFEGSGAHFNPQNMPHPQHAGDMPPLFSNGGSAWQAFFTDRFTLDEIVGRTVIIHSGVDDFTSQPSGNSGQKIACGKILRV